MMKTILYPVLIIFTICSCSDHKVNTEAFKKEQKQRAVKHVTKEEINQYAHQRGKAIADMLTPAFRQLLNNDTSFQYALKMNKSTRNAIADSFKIVKAIRFYPYITDTSTSFQEEKALWDAYQHNMKNQTDQKDNIQPLNDTLFLYTRPFILKKDTTRKLKGMWSIIMRKKALIIEMPENDE